MRYEWLLLGALCLLHPGSALAQDVGRVERVQWSNDGALLTGTLYLPAAPGPSPAVVLVHGAGQSTKEQWPYREHAQFFAANGIAALVYDKRGTGESTGTYARFPDYRQLAADAISGLDLIRTRPDIDAGRTGMWGRSQGGWLIAIAAEKSPNVRFAIPVAGGAATALDQEVWAQRRWLAEAGATLEQIERAGNVSALVWRYYATTEGKAQAQEALNALRAEPWFASIRRQLEGLPANGTLESEDSVRTLWSSRLRWQAGLTFDPIPLWRNVQIPILGLFAGRDLITPTELSVSRISDLLQGRPYSQVVVIPGAAHSMCPAEPPEQLVDGCTFAPGYLETMTTWIKTLPTQ